MTTIEQPEASAPTLTWLDSLARVVTVWGLGVGTASAATLVAVLAYHMGASSFPLSMLVALVVGMTTAGGAVYLDYVKAHVRVDPAWEPHAAKVVSSLATLVYLFVVASLISLLMLPILAAGVLYIRSRSHKGESWRRRADMFIGEAMPRISLL